MTKSLRGLVGSSVVALALATAWQASPSLAEDVRATFDPTVRSELREPVTLASKDGVLEVRLTAHQGEVQLDTVAEPVRNFLVFA
jgi:hypothetical protein